jgi:hypothetical protein
MPSDTQIDADFAAGFDATPLTPAENVVNEIDIKEPIAVDPPESPKYAQIPEEQYAEMVAAAKKTASLEQQLSKVFGTLGDLQKFVKDQKALGPRRLKVEVPEDAFADMKRDFPELAEQSRAGLEAALRGIDIGTDTAPDIEKMVADHAIKIEMDSLEDAFPDWRSIVGAVDISREQPDTNNPFRQWLATKDEAYQARINGANSAAVIERAIRAFQSQASSSASPAVAKPTAQLRAARMKDAVQPKGDGGQQTPRDTTQDEFLAGFNSR